MKFLLDANVRYAIGTFLQSKGHEVRFLAGTSDRALSDNEVLDLAHQQGRVLITNDKDFGHLIFRQQLPHSGVILFRLSDESRESYISRSSAILDMYGERLQNHFVVVTDDHVRYR
ncbi:MAG: hypothetical protein ACD_76C00057G0008 [uncultured bacterium]|nr:MAG: hypothetical protein ACD_76C00057G0008 [uncultured bacterium]HBD05657.1 hypothetical protein [Candidatus Uhrbacteria bacterium]